MRVLSIPNYNYKTGNLPKKPVSFEGHDASYDFGIGAASRSVSIVDKGERTVYQGSMYGGLHEVFRFAVAEVKSFHQGSSVESIVEKDRPVTNKIYFADPEEVVSIEKQKNYDFIIYDKSYRVPTLEEIKEKFKSRTHNPRDYNSVFKQMVEYRQRLIKSDIKTKAEIETELIELPERIEKAKQSRDHYYFIWENDRSVKNTEHLNTAHYFVNENEYKLKTADRKIEYYQKRIEKTKKEIALLNKIEQTLKTAEQFFIKRDIAAQKLGNPRNYNTAAEIKKLNEEIDSQIKYANPIYSKIEKLYKNKVMSEIPSKK